MSLRDPQNSESSHSWSREIDEVCDQFENAFRNHEHPLIERFVEKFPEQGRSKLVKELVPLEIDLFHEMGITVSVAFYESRLPAFQQELNELKEVFSQRVSKSEADETAPSPPLFETGKFIKHFQLLKVIGQGGFGTVWTAKDTRLERDVAIKIPRRDRLSGHDLTLFLREARASAQLNHSNIVVVHEVGDGGTDTSSYIVTELIDGPSLKSWLKNNPLSPRQAASLVAKIAIALQHAHERGIVHRDVKPANVLMDERNEPHLADFGLAKREFSEESLSVEGRLLGTPSYMAPEQACGQHDTVDERTDIYALGVILYEALTRKLPFRGELAWLLEQIANTKPEKPRTLKSSIPEDLEQICLKCMEKEPRHRYQTAQEVADDLHRYLNGESLRGIPIPLPRRIRKWAWRNRRVASMLAVTGACSVAFVLGMWWWSRPVTFKRTVEFSTSPEGCKITAVAIDAASGEPDPSRIYHAAGVTPLDMNLVPGDYLIVAVLNDQRFAEVIRRVPGAEDSPAIMSKQFMSEIHNGKVKLIGQIPIPRPDVTAGMAFIEGAQQFKISESSSLFTKQMTLNIPAFYVDRHEIQTGSSPDNSSDMLQSNRFWHSLDFAEETGTRLPSYAELDYLQRLHQENPPGTEIASVRGLDNDIWEWTTTLPPVPLHSAGQKVFLGPSRITAGAHSQVGNSNSALSTFRVLAERSNPKNVGVRRVRSASPRTKPEDFIRLPASDPK